MSFVDYITNLYTKECPVCGVRCDPSDLTSKCYIRSDFYYIMEEQDKGLLTTSRSHPCLPYEYYLSGDAKCRSCWGKAVSSFYKSTTEHTLQANGFDMKSELVQQELKRFDDDVFSIPDAQWLENLKERHWKKGVEQRLETLEGILEEVKNNGQ